MISPNRVWAVSRFTLLSAWRRWLFFIPVGISSMLFLGQLPRLRYLSRLLADPASRTDGLQEHASFLADTFNSFMLIGIVLAVCMGAHATGSRRFRSSLVPILARSLSRNELLAGRLIGYYAVIVFFHLNQVVLIHGFNLTVDSDIGISFSAYLFPLVLDLLALSMGMAVGTWFRALPGSFLGMTLLIGIVVLDGARESSIGALAIAGSLLGWISPPFVGLLQTTVPFASIASNSGALLLLTHALLWAAIFLVATAWRFDGTDLTARR